MAGGSDCQLAGPYIALSLFHKKFGNLREDEKAFLFCYVLFNLISEEIIQFHKNTILRFFFGTKENTVKRNEIMIWESV